MKKYLIPVITLIVVVYLHATQLKIYNDEKDNDNPPFDTGPVWLCDSVQARKELQQRDSGAAMDEAKK